MRFARLANVPSRPILGFSIRNCQSSLYVSVWCFIHSINVLEASH